MSDHRIVVVALSEAETAALNNALRREIAIVEKQRNDKNLIGVEEYLRRLESALAAVTRAFEKGPG